MNSDPLFLNGNLQAQATPASTTNYTGIPAHEPTDMGTKQCGSWANSGGAGEVLEAVSAQVKASVSGSGVVRVGAPNQFSCRVSLASHTLQLTGHVKTAANQNTDPALAPFVWFSRQRFVATVDSSGLVHLVGKGSTTIECRYPRAANLPFTNATPSGTEFAYATVDLTVTA